MPSKNPEAWWKTPGDTTYVIALTNRARLNAPILMCAKYRSGYARYTRSTVRAKKFPTAQMAADALKEHDHFIEPCYLPTILDVPKPRPRRRKLKTRHPAANEPRPGESKELTPGPPPVPRAGTQVAAPTHAYEDEPDPTPEQLADQERQAREAPTLETVSEQTLETMRDYARNAKGKLLRHYCKIRAEVYEAHLKGAEIKPAKKARKKSKAGETTRPAGKSPLKSFDIFAWNPGGQKEFIGTIEAAARTSKAALKESARAALPGLLAGRADMEITILPTPRTPARREKTYAPKPPNPARPIKDVWLVIPLGQETPAYAVRGKTQGEALRNARAGAEGHRFTLTPDDGRATSLDLWISSRGGERGEGSGERR